MPTPIRRWKQDILRTYLFIQSIEIRYLFCCVMPINKIENISHSMTYVLLVFQRVSRYGDCMWNLEVGEVENV